MRIPVFYTLTLNPSLDISCRMSRLVFDDINRIGKKRVDPGGKGVNVSRMLAAFGDRTVPVGFFGGHPGKICLDLLSASGIRGVKSVPIREETRTIHNFFLTTAPLP